MTMNGEHIQFHVWPWSAIGRAQETKDVTGREVVLPYYGSPVLSVPRNFRLSTDARHEDFLPLGAPYDDGRYRLYRVPHAIAASRHAARGDETMNLVISCDGRRFRINVRSEGAVSGSLRDEGELQQAVLEWMSFFDFCVQRAVSREKGASALPWADLPECIRAYAADADVQKRSLIVAIAEEMPRHVQNLVNAARRVLIHERRLLPAARAAEMDSGCLQWYFRQPGLTPVQKASANRQRLQAMSRRETFNTLENRVLREFLLRCVLECRQYVRVVCSGNRETGCAAEVNRFGGMCIELLKRPVWEDVDELESGARPNYVLQSDARYRRIWELYQKLLRKQNEEDWMWAWQGRTWADICTLLLGASLLDMAARKDGSVRISPLARAGCSFLGEQVQGSRVVSGSEPGPFLLSRGRREAVLELVHASQAEQHNVVSELGCTGGTLFFVLRELGSRDTKARVLVVWPVHTLSSTICQDFPVVQQSAEQGLESLSWFINMRYSRARLTGLVLADAFLRGEPDFEAGENTHLARLAADPLCWTKNIEVLTMLLDDLFAELLESDNA